MSADYDYYYEKLRSWAYGQFIDNKDMYQTVLYKIDKYMLRHLSTIIIKIKNAFETVYKYTIKHIIYVFYILYVYAIHYK